MTFTEQLNKLDNYDGDDLTDDDQLRIAKLYEALSDGAELTRRQQGSIMQLYNRYIGSKE